MADAAPLRQLTEIERWRLKPGRSECCIDSNDIVCRCDRFTASGWLYSQPQLHAALRGHNVEVRWAAADPSRAALFSRQSGTRQLPRHILAECSPEAVAMNGWTPGQLKSLVQPGDFLGFTRLIGEAPVLDLSGRRGRGHFEQAREQREYLRWSRYGFVSLAKARRMRVDEHHDGRGNGVRIDREAWAEEVLAGVERVTPLPPLPPSRGAGVPPASAPEAGETPAPLTSPCASRAPPPRRPCRRPAPRSRRACAPSSTTIDPISPHSAARRRPPETGHIQK